MIVVSDTTPLNYLAKIGQLGLLPELYGQIFVPPAVLRELSHSRAPQVVQELASQRPTWLIERIPAAVDGTIGLGAGENEAITLALELQSKSILMDDRAATRAARARGLRVVATLSVLAAASDRRLIDFPAAIALLRSTNFRMTDEVVAEYLKERGGK